jgi:signal transduction histidine kinase
VPMALHDEQGHRIAASDSFVRREGDKQLMHAAIYQIKLDDGRSLFVMRPNMLKPPPGGDGSTPPDEDIGSFGTEHRPQVTGGRGPPPFWYAGVVPRGVSPGLSLLALLVVLFLAIAVGAYPFVRRLTRRLETLKRGVEAFGRGALDRRVPVEGRDEVATLANSFNQAAERVEALVRSHKSLLANASHELRSPLARLKMATSMLADASPQEREHLRSEINTDIAELDELVDEVLLASRLEAAPQPEHLESVDLLALAVEEGARVEASVDGPVANVRGEERLLRRALRNLLENARRYGGGEIRVDVEDKAAAGVEIRVTDNGPGVPEAFRERIFEPFFRLPGHAERAGGVGLGLALVRQIVERHHGRIRCVRAPEGGGCFVISLPASARA